MTIKKVLFVNTINVLNAAESALPPLGISYLVSSLRQEFGKNSIEFKIVEKELAKQIETFKPDAVGISSVSQNYTLAMKYAKIVKGFNLPVIIGGIHISSLPSTLTEDMDVGVIGEGEKTIIELFKILAKKGHFSENSLSKIKGVVYWQNGKRVITKPRPLIQPLDKIPLPARDLMTITNPTSMFTSRGCPYRCTFCASSRFWNKVRFFSANYVVNEIKSLFKTYKIRHIDFWDDLFVADRVRLEKIYKLLKKKGLLGKLSFGCAVRSNLVDEKLAKLLHAMNFKRVSMGLESASPEILKYLKGDNINIDNHYRAISILNKHKIEPSASLIIGSPDETKDQILETLNFVKKSRLRGFSTYVLIPFPGTPVWEYAQKRKLVNENMDWKKLDVDFLTNYKRAVIVSKKLSREKLFRLLLTFKSLEKQKLVLYILRNPHKIPKYLFEEIKRRLTNAFRQRRIVH